MNHSFGIEFEDFIRWIIVGVKSHFKNFSRRSIEKKNIHWCFHIFSNQYSGCMCWDG